MNLVATDVSPLHLSSVRSQSRLTSAATVQVVHVRNRFRGMFPPALPLGVAVDVRPPGSLEN